MSNQINIIPLQPQLRQRKTNGSLAEWLGTGLQNRLQQFESARNLEEMETVTFQRVAVFCFLLGIRKLQFQKNVRYTHRHNRIFTLLLFLVLALPSALADETKTTQLDEFVLEAPIKENRSIDEQPVSYNAFYLSDIEKKSTTAARDLADFVPNFHIPDYGSQMTSSIYVRGSGARIDQPVVVMLVDNVPILNKNNYDFDLFDVSRAEFLRGPQGTLYGRNSLCGLVHFTTLSPFAYQGYRFAIDYSTGNTIQAKVSAYKKFSEKFGFSFAVKAKHSNGLFTNQYDDSKCDPLNSLSLRSRQIWKLSSALSLENAITANLLRQGGYAYQLIDSTGRQPVNYNDECHYYRTSILDGFILKYEQPKFSFSSITSYQFLNDDMLLDNDFLPISYFTLDQSQIEHAVTEEIIFQSNNKDKHWNWKSGCYGFYKHGDMDAPVTFGREGIQKLILDNANAGIHKGLSDKYNLDFQNNTLPIYSNFELPTVGVAAYHQSNFKVQKWEFTVGLRFDYEHTTMRYDNQATIDYIFSYPLAGKIYSPVSQMVSKLKGESDKTFFEVLPKLCIQYNIRHKNHIYLNIAKGYKAGGFNTQIFSDILQNQLKKDLMNELGLSYADQTDYDVTEYTSYDPEYNWTYEVGCHFKDLKNWLDVDASLFFVRSRDQQLTVFPPGQNTGRMMTNAGRSRSFGAEITLSKSPFATLPALHLSATYGYTNAKFTNYHSGTKSYDGKYVPYSPLHQATVQAGYTFYINRKLCDQLTLSADWRGMGKVYWDEENTQSQPFYNIFDVDVTLKKGDFSLKVWSKNLGGAEYECFRFTSMGNQFCQLGKPRQIGVSLSYDL